MPKLPMRSLKAMFVRWHTDERRLIDAWGNQSANPSNFEDEAEVLRNLGSAIEALGAILKKSKAAQTS